jgi:cytidylate kinase
MKQNLVISIDGPAGSGKSTISKIVAEKLGFMYVDTGAMYRALTFEAVRQGIPLEDVKGLIKMSEDAKIEFRISAGKNRVFLNGEDVTNSIRSEKISKLTHYLASILEIREILWHTQRELRKENNLVMEGRDIGTKVFPDAQVKIFLEANVKERARRRYLQLKEMGIETDINKIEEEIELRDAKDKSREIAPLKQSPDSYLIDSSDMTIPQVVDKIISIVSSNT